MITANGAVPYPQWIDSRPIYELGTTLRALSQSINDGVGEIRNVGQVSAHSWSGSAHERFVDHVSARAIVVSAIAEVAAEAAPIVDEYAGAIDSSQQMYSYAATEELHYRPYLPTTFALVEAAMAAEVAAIIAVGIAGTSFAASLTALMLKAELADTMSITRNPFEVIGDTYAALTNAWNNDDVVTGLTRGLNSTETTQQADGTFTQVNAVGTVIVATGFAPLLSGIEMIGGYLGLMNATPLTIRQANDGLGTLQQHGFVLQPSNAREVGHNLALTEELQRLEGIEPDQSSVIPWSIGTGPNGQRVITVHVPGIVPPGPGSVNGSTGERNITGALLSQPTGFGVVETSIRQQLENLGVKPGDRVVLYGHSYGGIIARNTANSLAREGIGASFVSFGSPDGPLERGVEAYMVQNVNDPVPAARAGGDGMAGARYASNQQVITIRQRADGALFDNHASRFYGENLMETPNFALNDFLRRQGQINTTNSGMVILEGPQRPDGQPNRGNTPYQLPANPVPTPGARR